MDMVFDTIVLKCAIGIPTIIWIGRIAIPLTRDGFDLVSNVEIDVYYQGTCASLSCDIGMQEHNIYLVSSRQRESIIVCRLESIASLR